jgi:hypothetical protein
MSQPRFFPQLIEVDPHLIKFSPRNPRKHREAELLKLQTSIEEVGMVQMPTVRVLAGGFYECIDGEGRVRTAQEAKLPHIWVVSVGILSDHEASAMLLAANAVRSFGWLMECRGLANLHRQGDSIATLAHRFSLSESLTGDMIAIGSFPEDLFILILEDIARSEEKSVNRWTQKLLRNLLPLRQELPGKDPLHAKAHGLTLDDMYDYGEVQIAVEKVIRGEIASALQASEYVARRRLELYQNRFDEELQSQLYAELAQAKQTLEEDYSHIVEVAEERTASLYQQQVEQLEHQYADLQKQYQRLVKEVAKRPEIIEAREKELEQKLQEAQQERLRLHALQKQLQEEARNARLQLQEEMRQQLEEARREQRLAMDRKLAEEKEEWQAYYSQKDRERQLRVETTTHQIVAHLTKQLAESQLLALHLLSPGILPSVVQLQHPEMMALLAQIQAVRETLEKAEERLLHGQVIPSSERDSYQREQSFH